MRQTHRLPGFIHWILTLLFRYRDIVKTVDGVDTVYLRRYFVLDHDNFLVKKLGFRKIFLHNIRMSDDDPDPHDHPWDFHTFILTKGYEEETYPTHPEYGLGCQGLHNTYPLRLYFREATYTHRVRLENGGMWSLVWASKKKRVWGFWTKGKGWIDWRTYLGLPQNTPDQPEDS